MAEIKLDYTSTISKARQIKSLAEDLQTVSQKLENLSSETTSYWTGEAHNQYLQECEKLETYITKTGNQMTELANLIIRIANMIKAADEAAARAASNLSNG